MRGQTWVCPLETQIFSFSFFGNIICKLLKEILNLSAKDIGLEENISHYQILIGKDIQNAD